MRLYIDKKPVDFPELVRLRPIRWGGSVKWPWKMAPENAIKVEAATIGERVNYALLAEVMQRQHLEGTGRA